MDFYIYKEKNYIYLNIVPFFSLLFYLVPFCHLLLLFQFYFVDKLISHLRSFFFSHWNLRFFLHIFFLRKRRKKQTLEIFTLVFLIRFFACSNFLIRFKFTQQKKKKKRETKRTNKNFFPLEPYY